MDKNLKQKPKNKNKKTREIKGEILQPKSSFFPI
jgi:hypothetical protein